MLISVAWLRELAPVAADLETIAQALTARGLTVDAILEGDVLDLDVPANRPDCLGHRGVARELAAAFGVSVAPRGGVMRLQGSSGPPADQSVSVVVESPELCARYTASIVRGVAIGPSPEWVVRRLAACGQRSINNVVDASNLVMLELGVPVHFFDLASLRGPAIVVRLARPGERLLTLDGVDRSLTVEDLVIADAERAVALAGVLGGADTEITDSTHDVLIEAAWFSPEAVRRTARVHALATEASQRFARGCDPEAPGDAQFLATILLNRLAAGVPARGTIDVRAPSSPRAKIVVRLARAGALLGYTPEPSETESALAAVGLSPSARDQGFEVTIPSWRVDLLREADLVEEIGRSLGYDRVPTRVPAWSPRASVRPPSTAEESVRDRCAALGFHEAVNYAMIGPGEDDPFVAPDAPAAIAIENPLSASLALLRRSILPGLIRSADQNLRRGASDVRLFEVGSVFRSLGDGRLPDEPLHVAFVWRGGVTAPHWSGPSLPADAYDAAGVVEDLLDLVSRGRAFPVERGARAGLHPGRSFAWRDDQGVATACCGPIHPELARRLDVAGELLLGEIDLRRAARGDPGPPRYRFVPRVPGVSRDLSVVLRGATEASEVLAALREVPAPAPASFAWIDRYIGPPLAPGEAAMTVRVILRPSERTLTDAETEAYRQALIDALGAVDGADLRRIDT